MIFFFLWECIDMKMISFTNEKDDNGKRVRATSARSLHRCHEWQTWNENVNSKSDKAKQTQCYQHIFVISRTFVHPFEKKCDGVDLVATSVRSLVSEGTKTICLVGGCFTFSNSFMLSSPEAVNFVQECDLLWQKEVMLPRGNSFSAKATWTSLPSNGAIVTVNNSRDSN